MFLEHRYECTLLPSSSFIRFFHSPSYLISTRVTLTSMPMRFLHTPVLLFMLFPTPRRCLQLFPPLQFLSTPPTKFKSYISKELSFEAHMKSSFFEILQHFSSVSYYLLCFLLCSLFYLPKSTINFWRVEVLSSLLYTPSIVTYYSVAM